MIYLPKDITDIKLEDLHFFNELEFDRTNYLFKLNDTIRSIFPSTHKGSFRSIDQIIMTGHYLYGKNRDFREEYMQNHDGKEFNINFSTVDEGKNIFFKNIFNLFLFGIVTPTYIKDLPEQPIHYLARPIVDEKNPSLVNFLLEEKAISGNKYRRGDGTPFYNYILKKSAVMPNVGGTSPIIICPIKNNVPEIKMVAENLNVFAKAIFDRILISGTPEEKNFAKSFIDGSWSPYLKAN